MKQVIILAAGLGSRLKEVTKSVPKSLIRINEQPILERNIEFIIEANIKRIILVVGYMHEKFEYLKAKYAGKIEIITVYNPHYKEYNTLSSMSYASQYFDMDSYIVTADLYMNVNLYKKYYENYSFYLHMMVNDLDKPEWIASLSEDNCIISVNKQGYNGSAYSGVSFWKLDDLMLIKSLIKDVNWEKSEVKNMFWDEILFSQFASRPIHVKHYDDNNDIYEIDDINDLKHLQNMINKEII